MSNLTRRNFFGVSAVVAGLGITACKKSDSDAGEKKRRTKTFNHALIVVLEYDFSAFLSTPKALHAK